MSGAYYGELTGIMAGLTGMNSICINHNVVNGSTTIGCNWASDLRFYQYHHHSHPIKRLNMNHRKGKMSICKRLAREHVIYIKWEDISGHQDSEIDWEILSHM